MQTSKIKIKLGEHEFEAEGPTELIQAQFETFKELVCPTTPALYLVSPADEPSSDGIHETTDACPDGVTKVLQIEGRIVWLTASSSSEEEAALLLMLGQVDMRNNFLSTGQEIHDGLARSGYSVRRVDRLLAGLVKSQSVTTNGSGRSMRYCLTSQGLQRARALVRHLAAQQPSELSLHKLAG